ncbi:MAG: hypothetical protein C0622_13580 [Desulfuromonas sp.]|nr:MAG: hypothetical protein C0622_13580 [Desulfuromonas sp.]
MKSIALELLRRSPLMNGIDAPLIDQLVAAGREHQVKGRSTLIAAEELASRLFLVVAGEVHVVRLAADGQECLMQRVLPGELFCLASLVLERDCGSQLMCSGPTMLLSWGHDYFRRLLKENPALYTNLLRSMACQVEEERDLRVLSRCCRADLKVAAYLLHPLNRQGSELRTIDLKPIAATASELGMARETLTRCLQSLQRKQVIGYRQGLVSVASLERLEAFIEGADCCCRQPAAKAS